MVGGRDDGGGYLNDAVIGVVNVAAVTWTASTPLPASGRGLLSADTLRDGRVVVIGGFDGGSYADVFIGEVYGDAIRWTTATPHPRTIRNHASVVLPDGRVLLVGDASSGGDPSTITFGTPAGDDIHWSTSPVGLGASGADAPAGRRAVRLGDGRIYVEGLGVARAITVPDATFSGQDAASILSGAARFEVVAALPATPDPSVVYLVTS